MKIALNDPIEYRREVWYHIFYRNQSTPMISKTSKLLGRGAPIGDILARKEGNLHTHDHDKKDHAEELEKQFNEKA